MSSVDVLRRVSARAPARAAGMTEIDIARGIAVFTMSLGHSASLQLATVGGGAAVPIEAVLTFHKSVQPLILFSGALLGYLYVVHRREITRVRWMAVDKALFLLTAAHVVLMGANLLGGTPLDETARLLYMTVPLAVCMILGSWLVAGTSWRARLALAPALLVVSWGLFEFWRPAGSVLLFSKEIFFGLRGAEQGFWGLNYPILPWFSLYLAGTALGDRMASAEEGGAPRDWILRFTVIGLAAIGAAAAMAAVPFVLREGFQLPVPAYVGRSSSLFHRTPPSLGHLLFFSGIAFLLTSGVLALRRAGRLERIVEMFSALGRAWLLVFVLHSYAYFGILVHWVPGSLGAWVVQCVLSLALLIGIAVLWDRGNFNRFLTLGIGHTRKPRVRSNVLFRDF